MSGRGSPFDEGSDSGLPPGIYVNPDTLPVSDPQQVVLDPDRTLDMEMESQSKAKAGLKKMGNLFKKGTDKLKIKKKDKGGKDIYSEGGASQIGDVMGKIEASSVGSAGTAGTSGTSGTRSSAAWSGSEHLKGDLNKPGPVEQGVLRKPKPIQLPSIEEPQPRYSSGSPHGFDAADESKLEALRVGFRNFFKGPPAPSPPTSPYAGMDKAPLHAPPPKSPCRISIVLFIIFALIIIIGIILLVAGGGDTKIAEHCKILGPCFLGLGIFGLIGEIFFMLFWKDDPLPMLKEPMDKINEKIGAVEDPYGLKDPLKSNRASYYPGLLRQYVEMSNMPASPTHKESIAMKQFSGNKGDSYDDEYPTPSAPPSDWSGPTGPAALGYKGPKGAEAYYDTDTSQSHSQSLNTSRSESQSARYYEEPPSADTSMDMRTRPGYTPSPSGIQNSSYQPDDSYRPGRMI